MTLVSPARTLDTIAATDTHRPVAGAFLIAAFTYVFLANAWLGDDAYITFRVVWNLLHGYGPVFNPGERVQAYTHPLWMLVLAGAYAITREFFFTGLAVSYAFSLAAVLVVARTARTTVGAAIAFLWLVSSKAFVDYTSSGLENPLSYLLLAVFYARFFAIGEVAISRRDLRFYGLIAGLAFVNRMDSILLYALPLAWLGIRALRRREEPLLPLAAGFAVPAAAWLLVSWVYYGFPLPNTYYAKVATGIPGPLLYRQGFAYLLNSFSHDPITLGTIGIAVALSIRAEAPLQLAAGSMLMYIAYTISIGGDFMSGRFFAMPFLVAVMALLRTLPAMNYQPIAAGALVLYNVVMPIVPVKTTANYDAAWPWRSQNGIKDERGHYHRGTNVFFFSPFRELPDHTWMREGRSFGQGPDKVTVQGSIGYYGLMAGPQKHLVDRNALSDPLLARLPVSPHVYFDFYVGHFMRDIPDGYLETIASGENRLTDPLLHRYYDRLTLVLRGPLFSRERLGAIWYLTVGEGRTIAERYERHRSISLSIRASNERFITDAGDRDAAAGVIRSKGRSGYLQYGPGIPMKAGAFRARWIGTIDGPPSGALGFVDVWANGRLVARRDIQADEVLPDRRQLAEIPFVLNAPAGSLEYRIWIHGRPGIVLERVELMSEPAPSR